VISQFIRVLTITACVVTSLVAVSAFAQSSASDIYSSDVEILNLGADSPASASTIQCLSFKAALRLASLNAPSVAIAQSDLDVARAGLVTAKSLRKPQISAFGRSGLGDEGLVNSAIENQAGLQISQRILDFGDSRLAKESAQEDILANENFILDAETTAKLEAGQAYIDWLDATERLGVTVERSDYFARELSALERALEAGGATLAEVAELSAESADADADRYELEFEKQQAMTRLQVSTRTKALLCPDTHQTLEKALNVLSEDFEADGFVIKAISNNPELKALKRIAKRRDLEAKRESNARLPIVDIVGIGSLTTDRRFDDFEFRERIGINLSVPLYTGSALSARSDVARAQARRADSTVDQLTREIEEQVIITYKRALLLNEQLSRRKAVSAFRKTEFQAVQNGYDNNIRTLPELVDSRLQFEQARLSEIRTRYNYYRRVLTFKSLIGAL